MLLYAPGIDNDYIIWLRVNGTEMQDCHKEVRSLDLYSCINICFDIIDDKDYLGNHGLLSLRRSQLFARNPLSFISPSEAKVIKEQSQYQDGLFRYVDVHYKDTIVVRPYYLYYGNPYTSKMTPWWQFFALGDKCV